MKFDSILSKPFIGLEAFDKLIVIAFYLTTVFAVCFIAAAVAVKRLNKEKLPSYFKGCKFFAVGYAVAFAVMMVVLKMSEIVAEGEFYPSLFWPIAAVFITAFALFVVGYFLSVAKPDFLPKYKFISLIIILIPVIVTIVMLALYYKTVADYYEDVSQAGLYVSAVLLMAILVLGSTFLGKKKSPLTTRELAYAAISIAMAFALSYIKFFTLPQGGSITLASMLPIMLFSYMFGIKKGVVVGLIYGVLQAIQDPWIIHPAQFFLDYPIAFGMIGFAGIFREIGFFKNRPVLAFSIGATVAATLRYLCHVLSGIFAFATYAHMNGYSAVPWGFLYNAFTFVDLAIVLFVGIMMFANKSFVRMLDEKSSLAQEETKPSDTMA